MEKTKSGNKVTKRTDRIQGSVIASDSALAIIMDKHKLEPSTGRGIIGAPHYHDSPFVRRMEEKYGHLFGGRF